MIYEGKNALVLGLGESGLAMALWLARSGARVRVADTRESPDRLPALRAAVPDVEFVAGPFGASLLDGVDFVTVSPGLAPDRELKEIAPAAAAAGIEVWGEIELFAQALEALGLRFGRDLDEELQALHEVQAGHPAHGGALLSHGGQPRVS